MSTKTPTLKATKRERIGTRYAKRVRDRGGLPAIVYGHRQDPLPVVLVDAKDTLTHFYKGEKVFKLQLDGHGDAETVLLKDVQYDYLGTHIVHADFARVDINERVRVEVPVHLVGEAKGLKQAGAILMHPVDRITIECTVAEIPEHFEADINELDVGNAVTAANVKLPSASMKLVSDPHAKIAQIVIQQEIIEPTAEQAAVEAGATEPEVITAKKPAEGEEGEEGAKPAAKGAAPAAKGAPATKGAAPAAAPAKGAAPAKEAGKGAPKK